MDHAHGLSRMQPMLLVCVSAVSASRWSDLLHDSTLPMKTHTPPIAGTRELIVPHLPYILIYRKRGNRVEILNLFHTSRHR